MRSWPMERRLVALILALLNLVDAEVGADAEDWSLGTLLRQFSDFLLAKW